ncbi:3-oxo-tetronate kinase [Nocardioides acrostichi]|uniref:3-oxo-tetronate kinase n=1 Tax=Nocardioides acrostichi TaxID=2784339 RepID=A0A930UYV0_9ACTN|nr:3-oxo-tetronate kinase [Nocardioides acrostichi]MBF4160771.1 four-carbon acid sugar kinase family protein [Nocardioides acrostichi]
MPSSDPAPGSRPRGPWLGIVADDVTGATDVAAYVTRTGESVVQLFGVPEGSLPEVADADCVVVALKTRSIAAADAVEQSLAATRWLESVGVEHVYVKYCSTFDSTPAGNIGPVVDAIAEHRGAGAVLVAPAAPENGRTVYRSRLFVHDQLLAESPMRDHPLNPMRESDLRVVLAEQSDVPIAAVVLPEVLQGPEIVQRAIDALADPRVNVVADAVTEADLGVLGQVALRHRVSSGSAGLAAGIAASAGHGDVARASALPEPPAGPVVVLSGSCSSATRAQVERFAAEHPSFVLDPVALDAGPEHLMVALAFVEEALAAGEVPLVYSTTDPAALVGVQERLGVEHAASLVEAAVGALVGRLVEGGVRRVVVAGGETSGAVVAALGPAGVRIGVEVAPGVPWTITLGDEPVGLLLKSGNFGGPDFFEQAASWT